MKLRLAEIFTSRMVLQHGKEINIFGTGETNQQVTITIQGQTATTTIINNNIEESKVTNVIINTYGGNKVCVYMGIVE